jgi:hypothetical protein
MRSRRDAWLGCVLLLGAGIVPGCAQTAVAGIGPAAVSPVTEDALHAMTQMAAVIFAGQVVGIRLPQRTGGTVEIDFAVEDGIRGVGGGSYTLREWGGLWAGDAPFRVGQRYLMLLHAPGRAGLSSPVGGSDGAIPILGSTGQRAAGLVSADGRVVDLRWVATRGVRAVSYAEKPVAFSNSQPLAVRADMRGVQADVTLAAPDISGAEGGASYSAVIGVLRDWERNAAR